MQPWGISAGDAGLARAPVGLQAVLVGKQAPDMGSRDFYVARSPVLKFSCV